MKRKSGEEYQLEIIRRMTVAERLRIAAELRRLNLELLEAGIRSREKDLSDEQIRLRMLQHILPPRLYNRFYASTHA